MKTYRNVYFFGREADRLVWAEVSDNHDEDILIDPDKCSYSMNYKADTLTIVDREHDAKFISAKGCARIQ